MAALPIMALAVAFALIVIYGLGWALGQQGRISGTGGGGPDVTDPVPETTPSGQDLRATFPDLIAFVEQARGKRFQQAPTLFGVDDAQFTAIGSRLLVAGSVDAQVMALRFTALGLLPLPDWQTPLTQLLVTNGKVLSDPDRGRIDVREELMDPASPYLRAEVVRQLARVLDVQVAKASPATLPTIASEGHFARVALAQGSAELVVSQYREHFDAATKRLYAAEARAVQDELGAAGTNPLVLANVYPQIVGAPVVRDQVSTGGPNVLATLLDAPNYPSAALLAGRLSLDAPVFTPMTPKADGPSLADGSFGAADLIFALRSANSEDAAVVTRNWGGGWFQLWSGDGDQTCIRFRVAGSTDAKTQALAVLLQPWADTVGATLAQPTDPHVPDPRHRVVEVTRCGGG